MKLSGPKIAPDGNERQKRYHLIGVHAEIIHGTNAFFRFMGSTGVGTAEFPLVDHPFGGREETESPERPVWRWPISLLTSSSSKGNFSPIFFI